MTTTQTVRYSLAETVAVIVAELDKQDERAIAIGRAVHGFDGSLADLTAKLNGRMSKANLGKHGQAYTIVLAANLTTDKVAYREAFRAARESVAVAVTSKAQTLKSLPKDQRVAALVALINAAIAKRDAAKAAKSEPATGEGEADGTADTTSHGETDKVVIPAWVIGLLHDVETGNALAALMLVAGQFPTGRTLSDATQDVADAYAYFEEEGETYIATPVAAIAA